MKAICAAQCSARVRHWAPNFISIWQLQQQHWCWCASWPPLQIAFAHQFLKHLQAVLYRWRELTAFRVTRPPQALGLAVPLEIDRDTLHIESVGCKMRFFAVVLLVLGTLAAPATAEGEP
jgi:hypothetical protein